MISADEAIDVIIKLMQTPLASLSEVPNDKVAYINTIYKPTDLSPFLEVFMLPAEITQSTLGTNGLNRLDGILQIDIHTEIGEGRSIVAPILKELKTIYKRGTTLTNGDISVECKSVWESTSYESDNWYVIPVNIRWYAYTGN